MLVDSHCHLDFPDFALDLEAVVARAQAAGVGTLLSINTNPQRFGRVAAVAERFPQVWCTVGLHPHEAGHEPMPTAEHLLELARHPKVAGFGETGLDYFYDKSPRDRQRVSFRHHIEAARRADLPVVIHSRDADADMITILRDEMGKGAFRGVIHCFTSGPQLSEIAVEFGLFLSVSGVVTFKKSDLLRATLAAVPLENLLVETDCPYLAPMPHRGKRNEPAFVAHTAGVLAEVKGVAADELARITTDNFHRLFRSVPRCG